MAEVKKENWFKRTWHRITKYFRELRSELKKVVWPPPSRFSRTPPSLWAALLPSACSSGCSTSSHSSALMR